MDNARKKEMLREYKETPQRAGLFAILCKPSGARWVGATHNLDKQQNSLWFQLRMGNYPNAVLQAVWKAHGEDAFSYEELEEVKDKNALIIGELLKERDAQWRKELGAQKVNG